MSRAPSRLWVLVRWGISLILLGVLIYFFLPMLRDLRGLGMIIRSASWGWLSLAVLIQIISYGFLTWLNALSLQPFRGRIGFFPLGALLTAMAFVQIAIPSAGLSGTALRVRLLGKFGFTAEESLFSLMVESLAEIIFLAATAGLGVLYLLQNDKLAFQQLVWMFLIIVIVAVILGIAWRILLDRGKSRAFIVWLAGLWNRIAGRFRYFGLEHLDERLDAFQFNLARFRRIPLWYFALAAIGKVSLDVATLGACFYLFHYPINAGILFTGYGLILLFSGTAALPIGLGMADASVPVIFSLFDVPASIALAAGLTYRLIEFWLVRFVGFFSWQALESHHKSTTP
jgi:uncharacterized protein (TIRG00374 family)